jgi:hypothetical protein
MPELLVSESYQANELASRKVQGVGQQALNFRAPAVDKALGHLVVWKVFGLGNS